MPESAVHLVFTRTGAAELRKALAAEGRRERVVALHDDLSFGPINPPDPALRRAWALKRLGIAGVPGSPHANRMFWSAVTSRGRRRTVWASRRATLEYCGLLELIWRLGDLPCELVDLTEVTLGREVKMGLPKWLNQIVSLAELSAVNLCEMKLWETARPIKDEMRTNCRSLWKRLRSENAAFRVLDSALTLKSAPITFFDPVLLSFVKANWLKSARVVADAMIAPWDEGYHQTGDQVLASRLKALADAGRIESRGDVMKLQFSEVRLPAERN
jgi:hypothetical protein